MTTSNERPSGFMIFLRGLVRLILVLLIGILIGALLYFLGTYFYQRVVIPTQQNTMSLNNLNTRVENQWELLNNSIANQEKRINEIENDFQNSSDKFDAIDLSLSDLANELDSSQSQLSELSDRLNQVEQTISSYEKQQDKILKDLEALQKTVEAQDNEQLIKPVLLKIQTIQVLQHITRSRLFLFEKNYGLAKTDLQQAGNLIQSMLENATKEQQDILRLWSSRMDVAISHLPDNPELAGEDLEIIWSLISNGFDNPVNPNQVSAGDEGINQITETSPVESTVSPEGTLTPTPTPTVTQ